MKKVLLFTLGCLICIAGADAAVRDNNSINRQNTTTQQRAAAVPKISERPASTTARTATNTVSRTAANPRNAAGGVIVRTAAANRDTQSARTAVTTSIGRSAAVPRKTTTPTTAVTNISPARAAATSKEVSNTFGTGYNTCRDSYFTCMDQFCAKANDTYRRCVCSSRLDEIKNKERALGQTSQQLQDFKGLNIDAISKTSDEIKAMLSASSGEKAAANSKDKSSSATQLAGISAVLNKTKSDSLSLQGKLDIAGDINAIWSTTDLTASANLMNLKGETLYNAVHAQCVNFAADSCTSRATLNMVVSAYGMYIENDCTTLSNALGKQTTAAAGTIRETEREMNLARLDNYNAHNSTSINECIAQVRKDITADAACGKDYVHCLDITGQYLNTSNGEPIYTANFYQLEMQTSLSGDVLSNQTNRMLVAELNRKKESAKRGLDTCQDLSDGVWDEFMRQAITEIYQGQQARIRQVKDECIDVVNSCYDTQSQSLKDFSNVKEQLLLGSRLELAEQMCTEKLNACSNLYGGGPGGLSELIATMKNTINQKIAKECRVTLEEYAQEICAVPRNDSVHGYPFACRVYAPGEQKYAAITDCNKTFSSGTKPPITGGGSGGSGGGDIGGGILPPVQTTGYYCPAFIKYTNCNEGYYMAFNGEPDSEQKAGNKCTACPDGFTCPGGSEGPVYNEIPTNDSLCGNDYAGSLYQKLVRYALQTCVRPSESENKIPTVVLEDVNVVMDQIRVNMAKELSKECERLGGMWVDTQWVDKKGGSSAGGDGKHDITEHTLLPLFYTETSANTQWGYCTTLASAMSLP